MKLLQNKWE